MWIHVGVCVVNCTRSIAFEYILIRHLIQLTWPFIAKFVLLNSCTHQNGFFFISSPNVLKIQIGMDTDFCLDLIVIDWYLTTQIIWWWMWNVGSAFSKIPPPPPKKKIYRNTPSTKLICHCMDVQFPTQKCQAPN